ncbi:helix-turn-helix domain-containing protein [Subtercola frigoramans]|uniref:DNA-binding IclR family transcriptional regulator n=1 Tax=Subtercola frigoramans TaxID=120298 RepID=A0ABS2L2R7_9MICO|nr:helix-turn-helix domain-containing protein [Subtercola frigoramans]MBM7470776.1 DNA-binding IclR family transcriptional regulator [Subtercola frigoramans]
MSREPPLRDLNNNQPRAIAHALAVLEEIATAGSGVTARDIAGRLGLSPATTYRILNLLVREEYVVRLGDLSGFALGARIGALAESQPAVGVTRAVSSTIAGLRASLGVAVHLFSVYGTRIRVLDEDPRFPLPDRGHVINVLSASAAGLLVIAETDADPTLSDCIRDLDGLPLCATLEASSDRGASSIAVGVRDAQSVLVNVVMVTAGHDYVASHRAVITDELCRAAQELAPLLS